MHGKTATMHIHMVLTTRDNIREALSRKTVAQN